MEATKKVNWRINSVRLRRNSPYISKLANLMAKAFLDYPVFEYIFKNNDKREKFLQRYFVMFLNYFVLCGYWKIAVEKDFKGVVCFMEGPETEKFLPFHGKMLRCGMIGLFLKAGPGSYRRWIKSLTDDEELHKKIINKPHSYIGLLAVGEDFQNLGIGRALAEYVFGQASVNGLWVYAETHDEKSAKFWKKIGFGVTQVIGSAGPIYGLLRKKAVFTYDVSN